jgi:hypothetical protein
MSGLGAYLEGPFRIDLAELERTRHYIRRVSATFSDLVVDDQFPYEAKRNQVIAKSESYSQSTNAMILFALAAVTGGVRLDSPLIPLTVRLASESLPESALLVFRKAWQRLQKETELYAQYRFTPPGKPESCHISWSSSFGWDDPFTLTWLWELMRSNAFGDTTAALADDLKKRARERAVSALSSPYSADRDESTSLSWQPDQALSDGKKKELKDALKSSRGSVALEHSFPVLRFVHLSRTLETHGGVPATVPAATSQFLEARLRAQLSSVQIPDEGFDASELVFSLEGLLYINPDAVRMQLLNRVFEVIAESQTRNPYWRPIKPFVSTPRGLVLFPLSVETANSLLRCCALAERFLGDESCFSRNIRLFNRYADWLHARYREGRTSDGRAFAGWHSEHVHLHDGVHLWETSQVLLFLTHYAAMLDRHIARSALDAANLSASQPWKIGEPTHLEYWREDTRMVGEPLAGLDARSVWRLFEYARIYLIEPRPSLDRPAAPVSGGDQMHYSLLLYGPPGTGKTGFAKELCKALRWPLITVTPSDFIRGGESEVEARAKAIFEVLSAQSNAVVLFDEIDRMILDRTSPEYGEQSDIFKFMTPSMLTKLIDLRDRKRVIFIVATNYGEKIDSAAKRRGRLDASVALLPPDLGARQIILKKLVADQTKTKPHMLHGDVTATLDKAAVKLPLMVYTELKLLFQDALRDVPSPDRRDPARLATAILARAADAFRPEISLMMYRPRFQERGSKPSDEFLLLLYVRMESGEPLTSEERNVTDYVLRQLAGVSENDWIAMDAPSKSASLAEPIGLALKKDRQTVKLLLDSVEGGSFTPENR